MKHVLLFAAMSLCGGAQAATYVYQANAYQMHRGRCGGELLPFQVTITTPEAVPPNSTAQVPFKTFAITAGGVFQWSEKFNKMRSDAATLRLGKKSQCK